MSVQEEMFSQVGDRQSSGKSKAEILKNKPFGEAKFKTGSQRGRRIEPQGWAFGKSDFPNPARTCTRRFTGSNGSKKKPRVCLDIGIGCDHAYIHSDKAHEGPHELRGNLEYHETTTKMGNGDFHLRFCGKGGVIFPGLTGLAHIGKTTRKT